MIFLSAGHSTVDPGATTTQRVDGKLVIRKEADIAAEFRNLVAFYLKMWGIKFDVDGTGTENVPLAQAIREIGSSRPALEFHCNSVEDVRATGVETLSGPKDIPLCKEICAAIAGVFKIANRGAKSENAGQHHRLGFVRAGGIIVELFFLSNASDLAAYDAKKWLAAKEVASVLARHAA